MNILKFLTYFFLILFLFFSLMVYRTAKEPEIKILKIGSKEILVEIADTEFRKRAGLSNREFLPENYGMLFVYDKPDYYSFWMKDMKFPLDFIWIRNNQIVEINEKIDPQTFPPPKTLTPNEKVDMILEVKAGFVEKFNIKIGEKIFLK